MTLRVAVRFTGHDECDRQQGLYDLSVDIHRREAGITGLVAMVRETSDDVGNLVLVGHNPSLPELIGFLTGEADDGLCRRVEESGFPTASVAVLDFDGSWQGLGPGLARITAFWTPSQGWESVGPVIDSVA